MHQAWHNAMMIRVKKLPKLNDLMARQSGPSPRQSWQQQLAAASMWAGRGRGRIVKPKTA